MQPEIIDAAVAMARKVGYRNITRPMIAAYLGKPLNWLQYRCKLTEIVAHLELNAEQLELQPGENGATTANLSGAWSSRNKAAILEAAYALAENKGFSNYSRSDVAKAAGVAAGLINLRWGSMPELRDEVVRQAIAKGNSRLIDQARAVGNSIAQA